MTYFKDSNLATRPVSFNYKVVMVYGSAKKSAFYRPLLAGIQASVRYITKWINLLRYFHDIVMFKIFYKLDNPII